jgi:hypothetical protein
MVYCICAAAVLLSITAAAVAIVRIRTSRSPETRRMTALTRLARKHKDPDRAMRLLTTDKLLGKSQALTNEQAVSLLDDSSAAMGRNPSVPELKDLVERVDAGENVVPDVVPDEPPGIDDQTGSAPDLDTSQSRRASAGQACGRPVASWLRC